MRNRNNILEHKD